MTKLHLFWLSLKSHPGVPVVFVFKITGVIAGLKRDGGDAIFYALFGFFVMSLFWIPVLWTAWAQKDTYREENAQ